MIYIIESSLISIIVVSYYYFVIYGVTVSLYSGTHAHAHTHSHTHTHTRNWQHQLHSPSGTPQILS